MSKVNLPKTERGQETLDKICKSAEQLFSEKGYYNTSINDIANKAGVAPGTIYIYFKDKLTVFQYLIHDLNYNLRKKIAIASKDCKTRYEIEYTGMKTFFDFVSEHRGLFKIIWEAQFVDYSIFQDYYENFSNRYIVGLKKAQQNKEIIDIDLETLSYCLIGIANFISLKWIIFDNKPVTDEVVENIMKILKHGIFR
ncbi:TetR/AcrR family transcriptional regulator [Proteiniborus sp.]|uniref:TetR/AcrR family transcriptional regulator n=1 Tax=Proteiniborus sp. TaxID=2079015 RepID=UPI003316FBF4